MTRIGGLVLVSALALVTPALAWDNATHQLITRLAIGALPPSSLRNTMSSHQSELERYSVEPDSVLKDRYGEAEKRRHYINLEYYGDEPFSAVLPDADAMQRRYGRGLFYRAGTLPWTIEEESARVQSDWTSGSCRLLFRDSGYLSHYVGDASQPLHSTRHFDGYPRDKGVHARIELAVEHATTEIGERAAPNVKVEKIRSPWEVAIGEIRAANALVNQTLSDDRGARAKGSYAFERDQRQYDRALMDEDESMFVRQVAAASSALASIWAFEWAQAGSPARCVGTNR